MSFTASIWTCSLTRKSFVPFTPSRRGAQGLIQRFNQDWGLQGGEATLCWGGGMCILYWIEFLFWNNRGAFRVPLPRYSPSYTAPVCLQAALRGRHRSPICPTGTISWPCAFLYLSQVRAHEGAQSLVTPVNTTLQYCEYIYKTGHSSSNTDKVFF